MGYKGLSQDIYDLHRLSVLSALKSYGNIHLITTKKGKDFLGSLPYTSIEIFDSPFFSNLSSSGDLSPYNNVWSLSKLIAYKQISNRNEPFLHIDYDVFLFKKLPDHITKGEIICQHIENRNIINHVYFLPVFEVLCKNKYFYNPDIDWGANCGVFGGTNFEFINFYVDSAFNLLMDHSNIEYWSRGHELAQQISHQWKWTWQAGLLEQLWLSQCLSYKNINPSLIFELKDYDSLEHFSALTNELSTKMGYTHLIAYSKESPAIMEMVRKKIKELG